MPLRGFANVGIFVAATRLLNCIMNYFGDFICTLVFLGGLLNLPNVAVANSVAANDIAAGRSVETRELGEVVVAAKRPLREAGVEKSVIDSAFLHDNVSLSMADVLARNSSIYVKNYGRATMSTVSFRGTSPSHTIVTWNGLDVNSPTVGMTDFSTIPAFFVDKASLLHGSSSVTASGGGLGGMVKLSTSTPAESGFHMNFTQGVGSFCTFDDFLRLSYSNEHWSSVTRLSFAYSKNNFFFTNHDKKVNEYDEAGNIVEQHYPRERNRNGAFRDINAMQEVGWNSGSGDRLKFSAWYSDLHRELPLLSVDYGDPLHFTNLRRERTLRSVAAWQHHRAKWQLNASAGLTSTYSAYDYSRETTTGIENVMTRSRTRINTLMLKAEAEWRPRAHWNFAADITFRQHFVKSRDKDVILTEGDKGIVGYDKALPELSAALSARWAPIERIGAGITLRGELSGNRFAPIPAAFFDALLWERAGLRFRASASRNYRFPSLNDRFFLPGGNPDLRAEHGFGYDAGLSFSTDVSAVSLRGSANWFDSRIQDWILWLPTVKGFFTPFNVKTVHAYGVELAAGTAVELPKNWQIEMNGTYSYTPSVNCGDEMSEGDRSIGRQLPYVPRHSATLAGRLSWQGWAFGYNWTCYSRRYTMSSNDSGVSGTLPTYYMNDISLEKVIPIGKIKLEVKVAVNNLFNEDYLSVLARPMPGINGELFISVRF